VQDPLRPPPQAVILREAIQLAGLQVDMLSGAVVTEVHLVIAAPARTGIN
jgi:hypothetical protein